MGGGGSLAGDGGAGPQRRWLLEHFELGLRMMRVTSVEPDASLSATFEALAHLLGLKWRRQPTDRQAADGYSAAGGYTAGGGQPRGGADDYSAASAASIAELQEQLADAMQCADALPASLFDDGGGISHGGGGSGGIDGGCAGQRWQRHTPPSGDTTACAAGLAGVWQPVGVGSPCCEQHNPEAAAEVAANTCQKPSREPLRYAEAGSGRTPGSGPPAPAGAEAAPGRGGPQLEMTLRVRGLHCGGCSSALSAALEGVSGVAHVRVAIDDVSAAEGTAWVRGDAQALDGQALIAAAEAVEKSAELVATRPIPRDAPSPADTADHPSGTGPEAAAIVSSSQGAKPSAACADPLAPLPSRCEPPAEVSGDNGSSSTHAGAALDASERAELQRLRRRVAQLEARLEHHRLPVPPPEEQVDDTSM